MTGIERHWRGEAERELAQLELECAGAMQKIQVLRDQLLAQHGAEAWNNFLSMGGAQGVGLGAQLGVGGAQLGQKWGYGGGLSGILGGTEQC